MDPFVRDVFIQEIITQCEFAKIATADLRDSLRMGTAKRAFYSTHAFLVAVGNISKIFWPDRQTISNWPQAEARGEELRRVLQVSDSSPIRSREFRNHFEHYDERLEDWAASSIRRNIVDMNIMPAGKISGMEPGDFMRNLDPINLQLTFHGNIYDLLPIEAAVVNLLARAREVFFARWFKPSR